MWGSRSVVRAGVAAACSVLVAGCSILPGPAPSDGFVEIPGVGPTRIDVPRPTTGGSACTVALPTGQPLVDRVAALRDIGLFEQEAGTDEALADRVAAHIAATWRDAIPEDDPSYELVVAEADTARVWWRDLEADVAPGNEVYVTTIREWAAISGGAFEPQDLRETWLGSGNVRVEWTSGRTTSRLEPRNLEDWIDIGILERINAEAMGGLAGRFELFRAFDQTAFVIRLTAKERSALEARGWCFE